jgi:hypothetical protein
MPSIAIPAAKVAITVATAAGVLTATAAGIATLFPGANAWFAKDDGTMAIRVKILRRLSTTTIQVRAWPVKQESDGTKHTQENYGPPSYGTTDLSAYTGGGFHLSQERQTVPVDPAYSVRDLP